VRPRGRIGSLLGGAELEGHAVHRSRISTVLIDAPDADAAAAFWSAALGVPATPVAGEEQFTSLEGALPGLVTAVQRIDEGEPRIHVDMETDDLDAETARLIALGATEVSRWLECRTLRVPGGHLVCVIPVHSDRAEFEAAATVWE
jgi:predicted enzyme related to lactoylglutathione lyase